MQTTMSADQARIKWRDTVDLAYRGGEIIIERYNKPVAVVVNYDDWQQRLTRREVEALLMAARSVAAGAPTIGHDDLVQLIMQQRAGNAAD